MFFVPIFTWLIRLLPYPLLARLGEGLGILGFYLAQRRRHICEVNLRACFPDKTEAEIRALTRKHFRVSVRALLEQSIFWWSRKATIKPLLHMNLSATGGRHEERPIIFWIPHFVNLLVASYGLALKLDLPVLNIYQRQRQPWFDRFVARRRGRFGTFLVARDEGPRPILRHIRAGDAVTVSADMDFGARGAVFAPFFGVPAATLTGPMRMARDTGAVVIPVIASYLAKYQGWRVDLLAPLDMGTSAEPDLVTMTRLNQALEQWISARPAEYLWSHRRFKTRPQGQPSLYE